MASDPREERLRREHNRQALVDAWLAPVLEDDQLEKLTYEPLPPNSEPQIRLLQLLPGKDWEPIQVVLDVSPVDSVEYEALSYAWGDVNAVSPITCNGRRLYVTKNLKLALKDLRRYDQSRTLWIDAVCIDQSNLTERAQQVGIMRTIYASATRTVIWLGETFEGASLGFQMLKRMHDVHYEQMLGDGFDLMTVLFEGGEMSENDARTKPTEEEMATWYKILGRPWFTRIWIAQELAVSREVIVTMGEHELTWHEFYWGCLACWYVNWNSPSSSTILMGPVMKLQETRSSTENRTEQDLAVELSLMSLLVVFRRHNATDPRDKVFALLGITSNDVNGMGIVPDYRASVDEVYTDVAKALVSSCATLDVLVVPRSQNELSKRLPSWVPDWSDTAQMPLSYFDRDGVGDGEHEAVPFHASKKSAVSATVSQPGNRLRLRGHVVDRVQRLGTILPDGGFEMEAFKSKTEYLNLPDTELKAKWRGLIESTSWLYGVYGSVIGQLDAVAEWEDLILGKNAVSANNVYAPTGEMLEQAFVRTISADFAPHGRQVAMDSYHRWIKERKASKLLRRAKLNNVPVLREIVGGIDAIWSKYSDIAFNNLIVQGINRRACWTEKGYIGVLPSQSRIGDEVWLVQGCRLPLVLRPMPDQDTRGLVGDCYLHGVMYGEQYNEDKNTDVVLR